MIKYVICPGYMISKNDREVHYISSIQLMKLYNVNPAECIICDYSRPKTHKGLHNNLIYLYPKYNGHYIDYSK